MRFRLINEGVTFIDVEPGENGGFIDKKTGLPAAPMTSNAFWDTDDDDPKSPLSVNVPNPDLDPDDLEPDDLDPDKFDPQNINMDPKPGKPFPIIPFLEKLLKLIQERNNQLQSADQQASSVSFYNDNNSDLAELFKLLDLVQLKNMLNPAKHMLPTSEELDKHLESNKYYNDNDIKNTVKRMINNIKVLIKILENIKTTTGGGGKKPQDIYIINGNQPYVKDANGKPVRVRRYGTHEV